MLSNAENAGRYHQGLLIMVGPNGGDGGDSSLLLFSLHRSTLLLLTPSFESVVSFLLFTADYCVVLV